MAVCGFVPVAAIVPLLPSTVHIPARLRNYLLIVIVGAFCCVGVLREGRCCISLLLRPWPPPPQEKEAHRLVFACAYLLVAFIFVAF